MGGPIEQVFETFEKRCNCGLVCFFQYIKSPLPEPNIQLYAIVQLVAFFVCAPSTISSQFTAFMNIPMRWDHGKRYWHEWESYYHAIIQRIGRWSVVRWSEDMIESYKKNRTIVASSCHFKGRTTIQRIGGHYFSKLFEWNALFVHT